MTLNCEKSKELIYIYADCIESIDNTDLRESFKQHLCSCAECKSLHNSVLHDKALVSDAFPKPIKNGTELGESVISKVHEKNTKAFPKFRFTGTAVAALFILVIALIYRDDFLSVKVANDANMSPTTEEETHFLADSYISSAENIQFSQNASADIVLDEESAESEVEIYNDSDQSLRKETSSDKDLLYATVTDSKNEAVSESTPALEASKESSQATQDNKGQVSEDLKELIEELNKYTESSNMLTLDDLNGISEGDFLDYVYSLEDFSKFGKVSFLEYFSHKN